MLEYPLFFIFFKHVRSREINRGKGRNKIPVGVREDIFFHARRGIAREKALLDPGNLCCRVDLLDQSL